MRDICVILLTPRDNKTTIKEYQNQSMVSNQHGLTRCPTWDILADKVVGGLGNMILKVKRAKKSYH